MQIVDTLKLPSNNLFQMQPLEADTHLLLKVCLFRLAQQALKLAKVKLLVSSKLI